jgi:hypothetical protein
MPDRGLFGCHQIERLKGVVDGPVVPVENGSEARWARDATGRQWVRKRESYTGFQPLLAEAASYLLGEHLGVPQPQGAVFYDGAEWSWMSERIAAAGEHWEPDMRDLIANLDELGRVLTLDAIVFNEDRHRRNLLVEPVGDEAHLKVWAIDSGEAKIGWLGDFVRRGLAAPSPHIHAPGLPIQALAEPAMAAAFVAVALPEDALRSLVGEACVIAREPAASALADALLMRCRRAPEIVAGYLEALGGHR